MSSLSNILEFIELKKYSNSWFEAEADLANGTLNNSAKRKGDLSDKNIDKISKRFGKEMDEAGYTIMDLSAYGKEGFVIAKKETEAASPPATIAYNGPVEYTPGQIMTLLAKAYDKQSETISIQAKWLESIETKMAQESTQAKILKAILEQDANFARSDKNQLGLASLVGELLLRDFGREAKGNPGNLQKILQDFLRRIGPKLSQEVKESIGVDGRT